PDELRGQGSAFGTQSVVVADGQHGEGGVVEFADQLHVGEDCRVAGVGNDGAVVNGDDEASGIAAVDDLASVLSAGRMARLGEGEGDVGVGVRATDVHADGFFLVEALCIEIANELNHAKSGGAVFFGDGVSVGDGFHGAGGGRER